MFPSATTRWTVQPIGYQDVKRSSHFLESKAQQSRMFYKVSSYLNPLDPLGHYIGVMHGD